MFGMAGLWDASTAADGSGIEPCAVITIPANAVMNVIDGTSVGNEDTNDGRMPAVLTLEARQTWLYGTPQRRLPASSPTATS